jgi:hypothetical protein
VLQRRCSGLIEFLKTDIIGRHGHVLLVKRCVSQLSE